MRKVTFLIPLIAIIVSFDSCVSDTKQTSSGQIFVIGQDPADYAQIEGLIIDSDYTPLTGVIRLTTTSGDEIIDVTKGRFAGKVGEQNVSKLSFKGSNYIFQKQFKTKISQKLKIIVVLH